LHDRTSHELEALPLAPRAGADLRAARERLGWSLPQVAEMLRIRLQYLEALEDGNVGALPGNVYALGYVRTYAKILGLDPGEAARRFKAEAATVTGKTRLTFPVPAPERGLPAGAMVLLGVVLAIGAYVGWYRLSGDGRLPAEANLQVPQRLAPLAEQAVRPPAPPPATTVAAAPAPAEPPAPPAPAAPAISPSSAAAASIPPAPAPPPNGIRIVLRANADAWMQVRDRAGPILLNRTLHPGETWEVPARPNLLLTTGNAGGTDLLVDGVAMPSLGGSGAVRRDLPLDPDLIKDGRLPVAGAHTGSQ
jgi:cytoskeleton protein RodZ